jgi:hypothetical protein
MVWILHRKTSSCLLVVTEQSSSLHLTYVNRPIPNGSFAPSVRKLNTYIYRTAPWWSFASNQKKEACFLLALQSCVSLGFLHGFVKVNFPDSLAGFYAPQVPGADKPPPHEKLGGPRGSEGLLLYKVSVTYVTLSSEIPTPAMAVLLVGPVNATERSDVL